MIVNDNKSLTAGKLNNQDLQEAWINDKLVWPATKYDDSDSGDDILEICSYAPCQYVITVSDGYYIYPSTTYNSIGRICENYTSNDTCDIEIKIWGLSKVDLSDTQNSILSFEALNEYTGDPIFASWQDLDTDGPDSDVGPFTSDAMDAGLNEVVNIEYDKNHGQDYDSDFLATVNSTEVNINIKIIDMDKKLGR